MILIKPNLSFSDSSTDIEAQDKSQLVQTLCEDSRKPSQPLFDKSFFFWDKCRTLSDKSLLKSSNVKFK